MVYVFVAALLILAIVLIVRSYGNRHGSAGTSARLSLQRSVGDDRFTTVIRQLQDLARRNDSQRIAAVWEEIELPLLQILPDCPPDFKGELTDALDHAALACRNRDITKRMMTLRNSMLPPPAEG